MNLINLAGIIFATFIMLFAMMYGNPNPARMLDLHGATIVIGGTIACIGVAFSLPRAGSMLIIFFKGLFQTRVSKDLNKKIIRELMTIAEAYRTDSNDLPKMIENASDPFLREAMQALVDEVLEPKKLIRVLHSRVNTMYERYSWERLQG